MKSDLSNFTIKDAHARKNKQDARARARMT